MKSKQHTQGAAVPQPTLKTYAEQAALSHQAALESDAHSVEQGKKAILSAIEAGESLKAAKALLKHGEWLPWLKENVPTLSEETAQRYVRLANAAHVTDFSGCETLRQAYLACGILRQATPKKRASIDQTVRQQYNSQFPADDNDGDGDIENMRALTRVKEHCGEILSELGQYDESHVCNPLFAQQLMEVYHWMKLLHENMKESPGIYKTTHNALMGDMQAYRRFVKSIRAKDERCWQDLIEMGSHLSEADNAEGTEETTEERHVSPEIDEQHPEDTDDTAGKVKPSPSEKVFRSVARLIPWLTSCDVLSSQADKFAKAIAPIIAWHEDFVAVRAKREKKVAEQQWEEPEPLTVDLLLDDEHGELAA